MRRKKSTRRSSLPPTPVPRRKTASGCRTALSKSLPAAADSSAAAAAAMPVMDRNANLVVMRHAHYGTHPAAAARGGGFGPGAGMQRQPPIGGLARGGPGRAPPLPPPAPVIYSDLNGRDYISFTNDLADTSTMRLHLVSCISPFLTQVLPFLVNLKACHLNLSTEI